MRAGHSEALDLFRKWSSERSFLHCTFSFREFAASFAGRVAEVSEERVVVLSEDGWGELVLPITEDLGFSYSDARGVAPGNRVFERALVVGLRPPRSDGKPDTISFLEMIDAPPLKV